MIPSGEVQTAASTSSSGPSNPTATRPGPPTVTPVISWWPGPSKTSSSWGTRDHPYTETDVVVVVPAKEVIVVVGPKTDAAVSAAAHAPIISALAITTSKLLRKRTLSSSRVGDRRSPTVPTLSTGPMGNPLRTHERFVHWQLTTIQ